MKKKLYVTKCLSMICALVCTFSVLCGSAVAKEPGIELLYTGVTVLYADINISSNGRAACTGVAMGKAGYDVELTLELKRDGRTIKKWSNNGTGEVEITETYFVTSGHHYQTIVSATVTDSRGNEFVESPSKSTVFHY